MRNGSDDFGNTDGFSYETVPLSGQDGLGRASSAAAEQGGSAGQAHPAPSTEQGIPASFDYDVMAWGGQATVCAAAPICAPRPDSYQSEAALEAAFIEQLQSQAYEYLPIANEEQLIANLRRQLEALNGIGFSDGEWKHFFSQCIANSNEGIVEKTRRIQEDHIQVLRRDDGTVKNIRLIDKANIHNNRLQVINQYEADTGTHKNRYDVTILVNGLPLVHVELKRRGVAIKEAFNQIERYQRESFWSGSGLFEYVQIFVISNGTHTKYYSNTTRRGHVDETSRTRGAAKKTSHSFEFTCWWAAADNTPICDLTAFTASFFSKHTLLNILTRYCVFTEEQLLLVMRPYQIAACERILDRIRISENNPALLGTTAAGGYIWHTTGSGKTLTSFKTARIACGMEGVDKVLFVVDRKDLDYQTMREYNRFEQGAVDGSESTAVLARQLGDPKSRILVTTIQKLACFIAKHPKHDVYGKHVVIIFDECHRSQFGDMHAAITKRFRKYHLFGFTGTPIFAVNASASGNPDLRTTEQAFGDRLHAYTIVDAIRDGNVLPFRIDYISTIRERSDIEDEKVYTIAKTGALLASQRIDAVAGYILDHYSIKTKGQYAYKVKGRTVTGFNSLLCTESVDMAKLYYAAFKRIQNERAAAGRAGAGPGGAPLKVAVIYSYGANEDVESCGLPDESFDTASLDAPSREFLQDAIDDYNAMFHTAFSTDGQGFQNYYKDLSDRMKRRELDLLIVVNMFLTGFDATTLNTLWVDKNLRAHGLIQAFSRTNRILDSVKDFGNIVCFRNLEDEVNAAISLFGDEDARGVVLLRPYGEYLGEYREKIDALRERFPLSAPIAGEGAERDFIVLFGLVLRLRNILMCFDEFAGDDVLSPADEQDYRSIYVDLHRKYRPPEADAKIVNDDLVFEIELLKSVEINIDYILMLVQKYCDGNREDREIIAKVRRAVGATPALHDKRDLIEDFIAGLDASEDVSEDWKRYVAEKRERELAALIEEEGLDDGPTRDLVARAFTEGYIPETGTDVAKLMTRRPSRFAPGNLYAEMKQRVMAKLKAFLNRFMGLGV